MHLQTVLSVPIGQAQIHILKNSLRFAAAWNVQRHCNAEWEFHFIRKGECQVDVSQEQYLLSAGQALLIEPGVYHQAKTLTADHEHFTFGFTLPNGAIYQQLSEKAGSTPIFTPDSTVSGTVDRLWCESKSSSAYADTYTEALLRCLCVELLRFLQVHEILPKNKPNNAELQLTQTIDTFFEQHFADACSEEALAKQLHFSRRHLVRILKKHYGMSFREKLNHARMDYASFLLRTTDRPVGIIGAEVGYSSESAFFKVFRQSFGMTPKQYRTRNK